MASTTLEECEIIQGCTLEDNKHSFQVKAIYQNLTKAISAERKQCELRYCCSFCVPFSHFIFLYFLKKYLKSQIHRTYYFSSYIIPTKWKKKKPFHLVYFIKQKKTKKLHLNFSWELFFSLVFLLLHFSQKKKRKERAGHFQLFTLKANSSHC